MAHHERSQPRRASLVAQVLALLGLIQLAALFLNALQPNADRRVHLTRFLAGGCTVLFALSMVLFALRRRRQEGWPERFRRGIRRLTLAGLVGAGGLLALELTLRHHLRWTPEPAETPLPSERAEFYELDRLKRWNRAFVASRPEQFANWPIPLEQFDHDGPAPRYVFKINQRMTLRQGILTPAAAGDTVVRATNSWGFRGPDFSLVKPARTLRIVCLGDDVIEGGLGENDTCPAALQRELSGQFPGYTVEVLNAGHHGQTLDDLREVLRHRVLPLHPDVVLLYAGHHDTVLREYVEPAKGPPPAIRHSVVLSLVSERLELHEHSRCPRCNASAAAPSSLHYREVLTQIARLCAEVGVRLVLSSYVTLAHEGLSLDRAANPTLYDHFQKTLAPFSPGELACVYARMNASSAEVARSQGLTYIDAAAGFPREPRYFTFDHVHLNAEGNALLARRFAEGLRRWRP